MLMLMVFLKCMKVEFDSAATDFRSDFVRVRLVLELVAGNLVLVGFFSGLWVLY